jgi:alpha-glucosidase
MNFEEFTPFERLGAVSKTKNGIVAELGSEKLRIEFVSPSVARIKISKGGIFDEKPTFALRDELNLSRSKSRRVSRL